jgi:hypothetical protein
MSIAVAAYMLAAQVAAAAPPPFAACLPEGIALDETVSAPSLPKSAATAQTVGMTLQRIGARCRQKTLVDGKGREVRFHRLIGCWGNPPADYLEQQAQQTQQLAALRKQYSVIEIPCGLADPRKGDES